MSGKQPSEEPSEDWYWMTLQLLFRHLLGCAWTVAAFSSAPPFLLAVLVAASPSLFVCLLNRCRLLATVH